LLKKSLPKDSLSQLQFGVFGQGDSSYLKFNFPAKKLHKRLIQLGATPIVERGDGDDQHYLGVDGALDPWLENWWRAVMKLYPIPAGLDIIPDTVLPQSSYEINVLNGSQPEFKPKGSQIAIVRENRRMTSESHFQDVRFFDFQVSSNCEYQPGDSMQLYPRNDPAKVQLVLKELGWEDIADKPIQFTPNSIEVASTIYQEPVSLRKLLEMHLDIFGKPRRYFFRLLSFFATNEQHAEKLMEFASAEGQNDLYAYAHKTKRTIFEVLQDFSSVKIPLKYLPDLIPAMRPRQFSISSCKQTHGDSIQLTVAVVEYKTSLKELRHGVCTYWMKDLQPGGLD
jgi:sulfite reductase alpha subunit-like flavoprotein